MRDLIDAMTLVIDNQDSGRYYAVQAAARDAVAGVIDGITLDEYRAMFSKGNAYDVYRAVGDAVADLLTEWFDELDLDDWWRILLGDVLQLGGNGTRERLGEHYMPEPDEIADLFDTDEEDE